MEPLDLPLVTYACMILVALCFWGTFTFMKVSAAAFSTPKASPLLLALWGGLVLIPIYAHPALAVFAATLAVPLFGENYSKVAMIRTLGAETFKKRATEFLHAGGPAAYVGAVAASRSLWIALSGVLLFVSRGRSDFLYWAAAGLLAANAIAILSAVSFSRRYRLRQDQPSGGA